MKYRMRKNSLLEDVYLGRNGAWTTWERAARFSSQDVAERIAKKCGIAVFGIF